MESVDAWLIASASLTGIAKFSQPAGSNPTVDIASPVPVLGHAFRWLVGGLDHQIEHHLAPRLPHTVYPIVAARFHRVCREAGVTYRLHPGVWAALRSHGRWLRAMGRPDITPDISMANR